MMRFACYRVRKRCSRVISNRLSIKAQSDEIGKRGNRRAKASLAPSLKDGRRVFPSPFACRAEKQRTKGRRREALPFPFPPLRVAGVVPLRGGRGWLWRRKKRPAAASSSEKKKGSSSGSHKRGQSTSRQGLNEWLKKKKRRVKGSNSKDSSIVVMKKKKAGRRKKLRGI